MKSDIAGFVLAVSAGFFGLMVYELSQNSLAATYAAVSLIGLGVFRLIIRDIEGPNRIKRVK